MKPVLKQKLICERQAKKEVKQMANVKIRLHRMASKPFFSEKGYFCPYFSLKRGGV